MAKTIETRIERSSSPYFRWEVVVNDLRENTISFIYADTKDGARSVARRYREKDKARRAA